MATPKRINFPGGGDLEHAKINLTDSGGSTFEGRITFFKKEDCDIAFPISDAPTLPLGKEATITFSGQEAFEAKGVIQTRSEGTSHRNYGFHFLAPNLVEKKISPELRNIFNRRGSLRVTPDPKAPVVVTVQGPHGTDPLDTHLIDISSTGIGLEIPLEAEDSYAEAGLLEISMNLPGATDPVKVGVLIRNRRLLEKHLQYGCEFDEDLTPDFKSSQDAVTGYVVKRQQELIQSE